MPKKQRKYNPNKLRDRVYPFTYEIRVWSGTTDEGKLKDCYGFAFPVTDTLLKADKYAFDLAITIWARMTLGMMPESPIETSELLETILPPESIDLIDQIRSALKTPCYGQLVRLPYLAFPGEKMAEYGTVNDGRFKEKNAIDCAKATIQRLSAQTAQNDRIENRNFE